MRKMMRYIYRSLLPTRIGQSIDIFKYLRMHEMDGLKEKKVLILSPHPDDDIVGCGGTISVYRKLGAEVVSVYMTDGRKGSSRYCEDDLVMVRQEEARRAARIVGIERLIFLNNRDAGLSPTAKTIAELSHILQEYKPDSIFLPFLLDNHPDHMATNKILLEAMKSFPLFMCYLYGIWTPLPASNVSIDITTYIEKKVDAINQHQSQIEMADLAGAALGLSKYYSVMKGGSGFAEVFLACPSDEYQRLGEVIW